MPRRLAPSASRMSWRTGCCALAQRRSTLVGVSSPCRVVRSMQVMARSSQAACHSFFTVRRVGMVAARRSTALRLTLIARTRSRSKGTPGLRSGCVNTRSDRSAETAGGTAPAIGVEWSSLRFVSMARSNLRRLLLLRRVPLGLPILGRPLRRAAPFRLLALRLGSSGRRWASGDGSLRRGRGRGRGGGGGGRRGGLSVLARGGHRPRGAGRPGGARGGGGSRSRGGGGARGPPGGGGGGARGGPGGPGGPAG